MKSLSNLVLETACYKKYTLNETEYDKVLNKNEGININEVFINTNEEAKEEVNQEIKKEVYKEIKQNENGDDDKYEIDNEWIDDEAGDGEMNGNYKNLQQKENEKIRMNHQFKVEDRSN